MRASFSRLGIFVTGVALCATLLAACGSSDAATNVATVGTPTATGGVTIDADTKLFRPFITVINAGTSLTFTNADTDAHDLKTVPLADPSEAAFVNTGGTINQTIAAGAAKMLTFTKPGIYDLYDDTQATIDKDFRRVVANKDAAGFPYAAEAVVWVKGNITGLPKAAANSVIAKNDAFQLDFMAVQTNGTGVWHNYDTDLHYVNFAPSFAGLNPAKIGDGINKVKGTDDAPPKGGNTPLTFPTPGLYYYYCTAHADFNTNLNRVKAHSDASIFPIPMEGFVLVQ